MIRNLSRPCGPWSYELFAQNNNTMNFPAPRGEEVDLGLRNISGKLFIQQMFLLFSLLQASEKAN